MKKIKWVMVTVRDMLIMLLLTVTPLGIGMAVCALVTGSFGFVMERLDMPLLGVGGILAYLVFKKKGELPLTKEEKLPVKLTVWYALFCLFFALIPLSLILHRAAPDEELHMNVYKQCMAVFIAPAVEEFLCRYMLTHIIKRGSKGAGISAAAAVITTFVWMLPHCYTGFTMLRVLLIGMLASFIYQKTGSIRTVIIGHTANNFAVMLSYLIGVPLGYSPVIVFICMGCAVTAVMLARSIMKLYGDNSEPAKIKLSGRASCRASCSR